MANLGLPGNESSKVHGPYVYLCIIIWLAGCTFSEQFQRQGPL